MNLKSFVARKLDVRRSARLEAKAKSMPFNFFERLPLEVVHHVFNFLTIEDLGTLTITSKSMRMKVELYSSRKSILERYYPKVTANQMNLQAANEIAIHFIRLGVFMKRMTCLYTTKKRFRLINEFLSKLESSRPSGYHPLNKCLALRGYGKFIHAIIRGWDESEYDSVFAGVNEKCKFMQMTSFVLSLQPGSRKLVEIGIRAYYRHVFLDECHSDRQAALWLAKVLRRWPMKMQTKLLYIIYGPQCINEIQWAEVGENVAANEKEAEQHFSELARAINLLHMYDEWNSPKLLTLIDNLTNCPVRWLPENVATLLYFCDDAITVAVLNDKMGKSNDEVMRLLISSILIQKKFTGTCFGAFWFAKDLSSKLPTKTKQINFWKRLTCTFKEVMIEGHNENDESEFVHLIKAQTELMLLIFGSFLDD